MLVTFASILYFLYRRCKLISNLEIKFTSVRGHVVTRWYCMQHLLRRKRRREFPKLIASRSLSSSK